MGVTQLQVEEVRYLGVLLTSNSRIKLEMDQHFGASTIKTLLQFDRVKKELSQKTKGLIYRPIYVLTFNYGHVIRVMKKKQSSRYKGLKRASSIRWPGSGLEIAWGSSATRGELITSHEKEPAEVPRIRFGYLLYAFHWRFSQHVSLGGDPRQTQNLSEYEGLPGAVGSWMDGFPLWVCVNTVTKHG